MIREWRRSEYAKVTVLLLLSLYIDFFERGLRLLVISVVVILQHLLLLRILLMWIGRGYDMIGDLL